MMYLRFSVRLALVAAASSSIFGAAIDRAGAAAALPAGATSCSTVAACVLGQNTGASAGPGAEGDSASGDGTIGTTTFAATSAQHGMAGVYGSDRTRNAKDPYNVGVLGASFYGIGISGTSSTNVAVEGSSSSSNGVVGDTHDNATGTSGKAGVLGNDLSSNGTTANDGVLGVSANGAGVAGNSSRGYGVIGFSAGTAMLGQSQSGTGVYGESLGNGAGVYGISTGSYGVGAVSINGEAALLAIENSTNGVAVLGEASPGALVFAGYNGNSGDVATIDASGDMILSGSMTSHGTPMLRTAASRGADVASFGTRSTSPVIEDVGEARLVNGRAFVPLDAAYAATIDKAVKYLVFITPEGENRGLYTSGMTSAGFSVTESGGGRSAIAFAYRIVAKPYDTRAMRLPSMQYFPQLRRHRSLPQVPRALGLLAR